MLGRMLLITLGILFIGNALAGVGDLMVAPTRIIFEERDRSAQVNLINRGTEAATYRIEFVQMRMEEDGQLIEITEANENEKFANEIIRYSPRQIVLEPNIGQTIRLMLRKPKDLPAGEYRSHLLFYALPSEGVGDDIERRQATDKEGFSVAITAVFRISIPVIVRHGDLNAHFEISHLELLAEEEPKINLRFDRQGNRSVYGDLDILFTPNGETEPHLLRHMKDFVLYTSNDTRTLDTELHIPDGLSLHNGILEAVFTGRDDGMESILARRQLILD